MENYIDDFKQWAIDNNEQVFKKRTAKDDVIELSKQIFALMNENITTKAIYKYLTAKKKITCSYSVFCKHVNDLMSANSKFNF